MLFSSVTFLYWFLPAVVLLYYCVPRPRGSLLGRNLLLFVASVVFYAWGEPLYIVIMLSQACVGWLSGLLIERFRARPAAKALLVASVVVELSALLVFKYTDFFVANLNALLHTELGLLALALPLGISFYTFQILSYTIDLYRNKVRVQRNPLYFATYVTLFPQLVAGPIVRYAHIEAQLTGRRHSLVGFASGVRRFCVGLGKKVLIANTLGSLVSVAQDNVTAGTLVAPDGAVLPMGEQSLLFAALFLVAFSFQIYFDFSGYSDMALGLGRIFGFEFPENFNYPLAARSLTDFWRRWHMSMSSWFRDYVYIPLGGNRVGVLRHTTNILIVWMVTGLWHGAGWNFVCWGLFMAAFLIAEKHFLGRVLARAPAALAHLYLFVLVALSWILFESPDLGAAGATVLALVGAGSAGIAGPVSWYYLCSYAVVLVIAAVGCTSLPARCIAGITARAGRPGRLVRAVAEPLMLGALLVIVTAFVVDGSFNPFIYFRF